MPDKTMPNKALSEDKLLLALRQGIAGRAKALAARAGRAPEASSGMRSAGFCLCRVWLRLDFLPASGNSPPCSVGDMPARSHSILPQRRRSPMTQNLKSSTMTLLCAAAGIICSLFFVGFLRPAQIVFISAIGGIASAASFLVLPARLVVLRDKRGIKEDPLLAYAIRQQMTAGVWNLAGMLLAVLVPMLSATGLTPTLLLVLWGGVLPGSLSAYILAAASWRAVIKPKSEEAPAEASAGSESGSSAGTEAEKA